MELLVREILSMSKLEQDTFKLKLGEVKLLELIDTLTKDLGFFLLLKKKYYYHKTNCSSPLSTYRL